MAFAAEIREHLRPRGTQGPSQCGHHKSPEGPSRYEGFAGRASARHLDEADGALAAKLTPRGHKLQILRNVRFWPEADMTVCAVHVLRGKADMTVCGMSACAVAIGGKADMPFCTAYVCF